MVEITINGEKFECEEGMSILHACRMNGFDIPTVCNHDAVKPLGMCGVCVVSVASEDNPDKKKVVPSCVMKVKAGNIIETESPDVIAKRGENIKKLLAYAPNDLVLMDLAETYCADIDSIEKVEGSGDCLKCGLCTRVCSQVIGLDWSWKPKDGYPRDSAPPEGCIGCLACAYVCPTGCIDYEISEDSRKIWGKEHALHKCKECGAANITVDQKEWLEKRLDLPADYYDLCDECKRKHIAETMKKIVVT